MTEGACAHTPGPWRLSTRRASDLSPSSGRLVPYSRIEAGAGNWDFNGDDRGFFLAGIVSEADARLIAAAPDMLAALKLVAPVINTFAAGSALAVDAVRAAIAQATEV